MLSVTAETAVYTQQAFLRTRGSADNASAPTTGFSNLVDSNTDAATANRDESARQPDNQAAPAHGDDSNSVPPADAANTKDKTPPARGETNAASNSDGNAKTTDTTDQRQQPADASATTTGSVTAGASTAAAKADAAAQSGASQGKGKATTKSDATANDTTADAAQSVPVDQAASLVVAVVAEVASPASPATPNGDSIASAVTATTAASSVPGAIAAAAASKVAADVAATELKATAPSDATVVHGTSIDAKAAATDQAQAIITAQQSAAQSTDPTTAQASTAPVVPDGVAALAQTAAAAQTTTPVNVVPPTTPTVKNSKAATIAADAKIAATQIEQPAALDLQGTKVAATDEAKSAVDPLTQKKPGGSAQASDTSDETLAKAQPEAAPAAAPTFHQHASIEPRVTLQSALSTPDLSNSNAAQSAAANAATAATPAPVTATALDMSSLTVMTGQAVPLGGLAVEISANAKAGNSRFEIRLDPPDLGRIDVRLDVDRNGQVTSRLFVEKSETLDLLRRDAPQLQQALQDAGLKTSDSGLQFSLRDQNPQQGQSNSNGSGQNPQRLVVVDDDAAAAASAAGRSYGRSLNATSGVDITV